MNKELNLIEAPVSIESAEETTLAQIDDLSLALIGGGEMTVSF